MALLGPKLVCSLQHLPLIVLNWREAILGISFSEESWKLEDLESLH